MLASVESLLSVLSSIEDALAAGRARSGPEKTMAIVEDSVNNCKDAINELQCELSKFEKYYQTDSLIDKIKSKARFLFYPFREGTLRDLQDMVAYSRGMLGPAIDTLHLKQASEVKDEWDEIRALLTTMSTSDELDRICEWLRGPDPESNFYDALDKRQPGTGEWFLQSEVYSNWTAEGSSFLWLHGFGSVALLPIELISLLTFLCSW